jgi:uncharacterized protein (TIGR02246 family)
MRTAFLVFGVLVLFAPAFGQSLVEEEKAIRELWDRFEEYYEARDAAGVASLYAADADRFEQVSKRAIGRAEIEQQYVKELARRSTEPDQTPVKPVELSIRFLHSTVAILDGIYFPSDSTQVHFTVLLTKEDGRWWLAAGRPRGRVSQ